MITIEFCEDEVERLRRERFGHPHPRVQRKMEAPVAQERMLAPPSDYANLGRFLDSCFEIATRSTASSSVSGSSTWVSSKC